MAGGMHGRKGVCGRGHAWQGGMGGRGACVAGGAWQGGGHAWQRGACMAGETATAADGTHPAGM